MRFSLIDRITALERGKSISAIKNLSMAEEYLADHFPGFPVMPGVLMLESMVQSSAWLMRYTQDFKYSVILLKQAQALKFSHFVAPGKTLLVTANVHNWGDTVCVVKGTGTVDGTIAVSGRLTLEALNLSARNPDLVESDRFRNEQMKKLFAQLWSPTRMTETQSL
jgi:3-hydroxyacyl-[acyl-carrier-protein] dehydratase